MLGPPQGPSRPGWTARECAEGLPERGRHAVSDQEQEATPLRSGSAHPRGADGAEGPRRSRCDALGIALADDAFVWSQAADHSEPWRPDRVSGAFTSLRNRENMRHVCLNDLRHFSATQLVAAGIDPRLVAGRLGHDASVLLRIYSHVIPARDQIAAQLLGGSCKAHMRALARTRSSQAESRWARRNALTSSAGSPGNTSRCTLVTAPAGCTSTTPGEERILVISGNHDGSFDHHGRIDGLLPEGPDVTRLVVLLHVRRNVDNDGLATRHAAHRLFRRCGLRTGCDRIDISFATSWAVASSNITS